MILPRREDAIHKVQLLRLLREIVDDSVLSRYVFFKGGTCASMLGYLNRFSIDLDFDLSEKADKKILDTRLRRIFTKLDLQINQKSRNELFYLLKYQSNKGTRNTLKLGIVKQQVRSNVYRPFYLSEIDRFTICQTIETMFSHKLIAPIDRYNKYKTIAGRDLYDIHHFFLKGYRYIEIIIEERAQKKVHEYFRELISFIEKKVTDKVLSEDLNYLLTTEKFNKIRKIIKGEVVMFVRDEIKRLQEK